MSKRIKIAILFFILLIISVIGTAPHASLSKSGITVTTSVRSSGCHFQASLPAAEKTLRHLSKHSHTDLPVAAVLTHAEKKQDSKSTFYGGIIPVRHTDNRFILLSSLTQTGRPPLPERIKYYIYTLEKILI